MIDFEVSETIGAPASEVFGFVSDLRNDPQWHSDVAEAQLDDGSSVTLGSAFTVRFNASMGPSEGRMLVHEYSSPHRVVFHGQVGKMQPVVTMLVEPKGSGARVTRRVEMQPSGLLRLAAPLLGGMMRKHNRKFLANLKRLLESKPSRRAR